jgi:LmbE family N-acetylglucosaminyl deacetylase
MLRLSFAKSGGSPLRILCLGAHCDDIEIGCGGTVMRLIEENPGAEFFWAVFSSNPTRKAEAQACAARFLAGSGKHEISVEGYRDGYLPDVWAQVKDRFEDIKGRFKPDLVLTHYRKDLHQDHRVVSDLTWNTWRDHLILEYEIPKYDGDMGVPNAFVPLREDLVDGKIKAILEGYPTQNGRQWFMDDTFRSLLRLRGMESNSPSKYAEAFHCRKAVL